MTWIPSQIFCVVIGCSIELYNLMLLNSSINILYPQYLQLERTNKFRSNFFHLQVRMFYRNWEENADILRLKTLKK